MYKISGPTAIDNNWMLTSFKTSNVVMPAYLVSYTFTDFTGEDKLDPVENIHHGLWRRREFNDSRKFALDAGLFVT